MSAAGNALAGWDSVAWEFVDIPIRGGSFTVRFIILEGLGEKNVIMIDNLSGYIYFFVYILN